jgi:hypothetical protein
MNKVTYQRPTTTLKLPYETSPDAELSALRAAGIPVNDFGVATTGFLHVRTTRDYRSRIFRWFDNTGSEGPPLQCPCP